MHTIIPSIELKHSYYRIAAQNLRAIESRPVQPGLFDDLEAAA